MKFFVLLTLLVRFVARSFQYLVFMTHVRSSTRRCSIKKVFSKFTEKQLCESLLFNEAEGLREQLY